jgi:hypothetical protein
LQFGGAAAGDQGTEPANLCLLLPREQQKLWVLFTQWFQFPWHFMVKVAGSVVGASMERCVPVVGGGDAGLTSKY